VLLFLSFVTSCSLVRGYGRFGKCVFRRSAVMKSQGRREKRNKIIHGHIGLPTKIIQGHIGLPTKIIHGHIGLPTKIIHGHIGLPTKIIHGHIGLPTKIIQGHIGLPTKILTPTIYSQNGDFIRTLSVLLLADSAKPSTISELRNWRRIKCFMNTFT